MKGQLIGKDPDAGKDRRQKEKGAAEDEIDSIPDSMDLSLSKLRETVKDRGAWWAAVYAVAQSRTRLKRLSSSSGKTIGGFRHAVSAVI